MSGSSQPIDLHDLAAGRCLLAALTPWDPCDSWSTHQRPSTGLSLDRPEDARAILWLLEHAEALVTLAEQVAALRMKTTVKQLGELRGAVRILNGTIAGVSPMSVMPMLAMAAPTLLADATALAALVKQVQR